MKPTLVALSLKTIEGLPPPSVHTCVCILQIMFTLVPSVAVCFHTYCACDSCLKSLYVIYLIGDKLHFVNDLYADSSQV